MAAQKPMTTRNIAVLAAIAALEAAVIAVLLHHGYVVVTIDTKPVIVTNPFYWAFKFDAPDQKFDQLARQYPNWVSNVDSNTGWSALSECTALRRTNVARILIANGADAESLIKQEKLEKDDAAVNFLRGIKQNKK